MLNTNEMFGYLLHPVKHLSLTMWFVHFYFNFWFIPHVFVNVLHRPVQSCICDDAKFVITRSAANM